VDRAALRRIMLNLMENALKYGPDEQRITVGMALFIDVVRLWVDDEGDGIPRAVRERVFESFFRLNRELDRRITGSGIGLAVVRQLATLHGGRAWADEAPGGGARHVVEFTDAYVRPQEEGTGWAVA
jgi:signal transduction histidine kinase